MDETNPELHLYEELLLLALKDREGTVASGTWHRQALAGALLAELVLEGHLRLAPDGSTVEPEGSELPAPTDRLLARALEVVRASPRPRSLGHWMSKLGNLKGLVHRAAQGPCERGILRADAQQVLLFFERRAYPEVDPAPERRLVERLEALIGGSREAADARALVLLSLAHQTGLLKVVFDKEWLRSREAAIRALVEGDAFAEAARRIQAAVHAAILVTCVVPTLTQAG